MKYRSIDRWSWLLISMKEKLFLKAFLFLSYSNRQYTFEYYHNYWVIIDTWCLGTLPRENHISPLCGTSFPKRDSTGCAIFDVPLKPLGFLAPRDLYNFPIFWLDKVYFRNASCVLNYQYISTFYYFQLVDTSARWTVSPVRRCHPPSSQCFRTVMVYKIY